MKVQCYSFIMCLDDIVKNCKVNKTCPCIVFLNTCTVLAAYIVHVVTSTCTILFTHIFRLVSIKRMFYKILLFLHSA